MYFHTVYNIIDRKLLSFIRNINIFPGLQQINIIARAKI